MSSLFSQDEQDNQQLSIDELLAAIQTQSANQPSTTATTSRPIPEQPFTAFVDGDPMVRKQAQERIMRGVDVVGSTFGGHLGLPEYSPDAMRQHLNDLRTAASQDPETFAKMVASYTGKTMTSTPVQLALGAVNIPAQAARYGSMAALKATGLSGVAADVLGAFAPHMLAEAGQEADASLPKGGRGTPGAKVTDGEEIGPKMPSLSRKDIASAINGGAARRSDGSIDGSKVIQLLKGQTLASDVGGGSVSHYKQTSHYEDLLDPGAAPRALQAYAQAKNDVYARYKESLKAVANNPKARDSMLAQIEKQANEEALRVVPKEYHDLVASSEEAKPAEALAPNQEESGFWDAAKKPLAIAAATLITALVARKFLSPQQAAALAETAGASAEAPAAAAASKFAGLKANLGGIGKTVAEDDPEIWANAAKSNLSSLSSKIATAPEEVIAQQGRIPYATRGQIPYIPQARGEPPDSVAARIARALRRTSSEGSGPQINLGPEIENATLKSGLPGNSLATPRITSKAGLARVPRGMVSEGSGPTISAGRTIAGEAPVPQPTRNLPAEFSDKFGWAGGGKGPTIDPNAAQKAIKAIDTAIYDRKAASLQLSKLGKTSGRDTELDRLMALREHIIRMVK